MTEPVKRQRGRPVGSKSAKSIRQTKLKLALDAIKPGFGDAVVKAHEIVRLPINSDLANPTTQLQAAKFLIEKFVDLTDEVYTKEPDQLEDIEDDEQENAEAGSVLSFELVK